VRRRIALLAGLALLAGVTVFGVHLYKKSSVLGEPALVTKSTDIHRATSPALDARIGRLLDDRSNPGRNANAKYIALTFDDGPYPVDTPLLLDELAELHVQATFFLIGRDARAWPDLTRRIEAGGNEIGNHTMTHPNMDRLPPSGVKRELAQGAATLAAIVGDPAITAMFRPPHGRFTEETLATARSAGYDTILWTDDPGDWRPVPPSDITEHILKHATAPEVLLLHNGRQATMAMLPAVVGRFRKAGYMFLTVGQIEARVAAIDLNRPAKVPLAP